MTAPALDVATQQALRAVAIDCLRAPDDERAAERAQVTLSDPAFDWPAFEAFAHKQRISPLLHYYLGNSGLFPNEVAASFQRAYLQTTWDNAQRLEELYALLDSFEAANIPVTLLKGMALMHSIYDKAAQRPMSDMDLLFFEDDALRAHEIFLSFNYTAPPHFMPKDLEIEVAYQKKTPPFYTIELHTSLYNPPHTPTSAQLNWFLNRRAAYQKDGHTIWTFDPTAQLLQLAAHLWLHHNGGDLLGFYDIYRHTHLYFDQIDWGLLITTARDFELVLPLKHILTELSGTWGTPIPQQVLEHLAAMSPSQRERLKFGKHWDDDEQNYLSVLYGRSMGLTSWSSRLRYAWAVTFPNPEYIRSRFNARGPFQLIFFYFYRLFIRAVQQTKRAIGKLRVTKMR